LKENEIRQVKQNFFQILLHFLIIGLAKTMGDRCGKIILRWHLKSKKILLELIVFVGFSSFLHVNLRWHLKDEIFSI